MSKKQNYFSKKFISKPENMVTIGFANEPCDLSDEINKINGVSENVKMVLHRLLNLSSQGRVWNHGIHDFKSVARCSDDDTWNEETGRKVADARNKMKFHDYRLRQLGRMLDLLFDVDDALHDIWSDQYDALYDAYNELSKYTGEEIEHESN